MVFTNIKRYLKPPVIYNLELFLLTVLLTSCVNTGDSNTNETKLQQDINIMSECAERHRRYQDGTMYFSTMMYYDCTDPIIAKQTITADKFWDEMILSEGFENSQKHFNEILDYWYSTGGGDIQKCINYVEQKYSSDFNQAAEAGASICGKMPPN